MKRLAWLCPLLLLAACGKPEPTPAEQNARAEADIAAVEKAQDIPPVPISLEVIGYPDIEKNHLQGAGCAFAPKDGGLGALLLANEGAAYIKIDGKLERLAPDPGSPKLPLGAHGKYDGKVHSLVLDIGEGEGQQSGMETMNYPAELMVRNERDQVVYQANGTAQCGA
ncbi:MAG: hypothetical protein ACTHKM_07440 [Tsuneonella sp.]